MSTPPSKGSDSPLKVASITGTIPGTTAGASGQKPKQQGLSTAVEFEPPLACVRRILKNTLPASTNVGKDASAAFARSAGIFIIYLTACANDFARENRRQTITANDVLAAVKELDFDEFTPKLQEFLDAYRANEKRKKDAKAQAAAAKADAGGGADNEDSSHMDQDSESKPTTPQSTTAKGVSTRVSKHEKDDESTEDEGAEEEEDNVAQEDDGDEEDLDNLEASGKKRKRDDGDEVDVDE